ncbi:MAG: SusC/RagA family TonB-linked outer membrane protein [Prolixibacteraceae bacterium]
MERNCLQGNINTAEYNSCGVNPVEGIIKGSFLDSKGKQPTERAAPMQRLKQILSIMFLLSIPVLSFSQKTISGILKDETKNPLPGATVVVKGTTMGAITNIDGFYQIEVPSNSSVLQYSFIGYVEQEIIVGSKTTINVLLVPDMKSLDEVVIVGYGTTKKADLTSSITTVNKDEIAKVPVTSFAQALQGKAAGVTVVQSGAPGGKASIRIRGTGSINGASPLYVVDGIIGASAPSTADIETIQILKDATSSAIYGSRGSNGVIIITTKKGSKGEPKVTLKTLYGGQNTTNRINMLNADEFIQYWESNLAIDNMLDESGNKLYPNGAGIARPARVDSALVNPNKYYNSTNWQDEIYQLGTLSNTNLSVSSGNENANWLVSIDHKNNKGIQMGSGYQSTGIQLNSDFKLGILTIGENINITTSESLDNSSRLQYAMRQSPLLQVYNPESTNAADRFEGNTELDNSNNSNPVADILGGSRLSNTEAIQGSFYAELQLLKSLKIKTNYNLIYYNGTSVNKNYKRIEGTAGPQIDKTTLSQSGYRKYVSQFESILSYNKSFGAHHIAAMAGYTQEEEIYRGYSAFADNYAVSDPMSLGSRSGDATLNIGGGYNEYAMQSVLARVMYDFQGRYLFTANMRSDGTSVFQKGRRWSTFPSVSAGWRISEEPFMSSIDLISNLKLRGGYGKIGSQNLPGGRSSNNESLMSTAAYIINNQVATGVTSNSMIDAGLTWETTETSNLGMDLDLYYGKIQVVTDYYRNVNNGMILSVPMPYSTGLSYSSFVTSNAGSLLNSGWEFSVTGHKTGKLAVDVIGTLTFENTEILSLGKADYISGGTTQYYREGLTITSVGSSIGDFYGYVFDGIYQIGDTNIPTGKQAGDVRYTDINGDGQLTAEDRTRLGSPVPDFTYSLSVNLMYQNFDLSLFFNGVYGNEIFNHNRYHSETLAKSFNQSVQVLEAWTPTNPSTTTPRYTEQHTNNYALASSRFIEDGSYARFQNITLGYTLTSTFLNKIKFSNVRVYGTVQNLFTITNYSGLDPELYVGDDVLGRGIDNSIYPMSRTFAFGIEIGF